MIIFGLLFAVAQVLSSEPVTISSGQLTSGTSTTLRVHEVSACSIGEARRAMNKVERYLEEQKQFSNPTFVSVPAIATTFIGSEADKLRNDARELRRKADALDEKDRAIKEFHEVLACLNDENRVW